jgi:hypothetical protein
MIGITRFLNDARANSSGPRRPSSAAISMCLIAHFLLITSAANAYVITLGAFSGSETVETFSSAVPGDEAISLTYGDVTIENIGDLACCPTPGGPTTVVSGSLTGNLFGHVDPGAASYGNSIRDGQGQAHFLVDFAQPMQRAGMFISHSSSPLASWDVTAHYGDGSSESILVTQQNFAEDEFVGFEDLSGVEQIEIIKIDGRFAYYSFIDDVRSEIPVPEPSANTMLKAGLSLIVLLGRRRGQS